MTEELVQKQQDYYYDAFISYRHVEPDMTIAKELHEVLENYHIPKRVSKRTGIKRIFRDREELPTSSNLSHDIRNALMNSRFLIVVCSPRTPISQWCSKEIEEFREFHKDNDRILSILIEGEPRDSFPNALCFYEEEIMGPDGTLSRKKISTEPLAADIRGNSLREMLKRLKVEKLRLLAPMLGVKFDDLKQRHRETVMKRVIALSSSISLFFAVFGGITIFQSGIINGKNVELTEQRDQLLISESKVLAEKSEGLTDASNITEGIRIALEALPEDIEAPERPYVKEAEWALLKAVMNNGQYSLRTILSPHNGYVDRVRYSRDAKLMLTVSAEKTIRVWAAGTGRKLMDFKKHANGYGDIAFAEFSEDGRYILSSSYWDNSVYLWDAQTGQLIHDLSYEEGNTANSISCVGFSPDTKKIMIMHPDGLHLYETKTGKELIVIKLLDDVDDNRQSTDVKAQDDVEGLATFNSKGDRIAVVCRSRNDVRGYIVDASTGEKITTFDTNINFSTMHDRNKIKFSLDDTFILANTFSGTVLINSGNGLVVKSFEYNSEYYDSFDNADFSDDGRLLALGINLKCILYDLKTSTQIFETELKGHIKFVPKNGNILINGSEILDISTRKAVAAFEGYESVLDVNCSPDGRNLIAGCLDNRARIWNLESEIEVQMIENYNQKIEGRANYDFYPLKRDVSFVQKHFFDDSLYGNPSLLMATSSNGQYAAFSYPDGAIELYDLDLTKDKEVESFSIIKPMIRRIVALRFSPVNNCLLIASEDGQIIIYDMDEQAVVANMNTDGTHALQFALYSTDAKYIIAYDYRNKLTIWNGLNYDQIFTIDIDKEKDASDIGFTKDSQYAVIVYPDQSALRIKLFPDSQQLIDYSQKLISE